MCSIGFRRLATLRTLGGAAEEPVFGETNDGRELAVFWSEGFEGIDGPEPIVQDAKGDVVARDGEEITIPEGAWPELHGYFVCPSEVSLYVLEEEPS